MVLELGAVEELATTCETRFSVGFDFATIISFPFSSCILFDTVLAASRAEIANVEQTEKMVPFITREIALCHNVCELFFGVNVFDLDLWVQVDSAK